MPSSLPWSDPDSDPVADLRAILDAARQDYLKGLNVSELARYQFESWLSHHLLAHGGSFLFERHNEFTEWIECASCHNRLVLPLGKHKGKINGLTPALVVLDEMFDFEQIYQGGRRSGKRAQAEAFYRKRYDSWPPQDDRSTPSPDTHHDALIALCLEHPWLSPRTNTGGSAAAIPSTR